ncbi:MAG: GAF domain-containing protein [Anaerolineaceae bacterium]|nr:GAF domain-containing protein [Anaerolineaceae bacterium]
MSAVVLIVSGGLQIAYNYQTQRNVVFNQQQLIAQEAATAVKDFIEDKFSVLETAVKLGNIADVPAEEQERILGNALGFQPSFRQLALFDANSQLVSQSSRLVQARSDVFASQIVEQVFTEARQTERYISPVTIDSESSEPLVIIAVPIYSRLGDFEGLLAAELNLKFMWDLVDQLEVGETGYAYVVNEQGDLLAFADTARVLKGENLVHLPEVSHFVEGEIEPDHDPELSLGINGETTAQAFVALGSPDWAVFTEIPAAEAFQPVTQSTIVSAVVVLVAALLSGVVGVSIARRLVRPLLELTETAVQIAEGNINLEASAKGNLEVNQLSTAFNNMTARLRDSIDSLEQRVADRTRALEISGKVSRQLSNILDQNELVRAVVEQVKDSFDYYHAHIYLFDDADQNLLMAGGTGEAGQQMLANKHQIPAGKGLVGRAGQTGQAVLVPDTDQAQGWLPNPLLPDTKAEIAVPIMSGDKVWGVLDVQHNVTNGLSQADVDLLESIANQMAVALRNANMFAEAQKQAKREALVNDINQKILSTKDVQEAMQVAVREIGHALDASQTMVRFMPVDSEKRFGDTKPLHLEQGQG